MLGLKMEVQYMIAYPPEIEHSMQNFYHSLSEKDRRRYAAIEASKLGHGGKVYVSNLFGCDPDTVAAGEVEIGKLPHDEAQGRVRKKGRTKRS